MAWVQQLDHRPEGEGKALSRDMVDQLAQAFDRMCDAFLGCFLRYGLGLVGCGHGISIDYLPNKAFEKTINRKL